MRTPVRLAARLLKFQAAASFQRNASPIYRWSVEFSDTHLVAASISKPSSRAEATKAATAERLKVRRSAPWAKNPIVWLTGTSEILEQSSTPGLARMLRDYDRTVFLETDGLHLRKRIHEFKPDSRLYLAVRFYGMPETHDARTQRQAAFLHAVEGIRAAQLSGFLVCAHVVMEAETQRPDIERLLDYLRTLHVDGVIVSSAEDDSSGSTRETVAHFRKLLRNFWWANFSKLFQESLRNVERSVALHTETRGGFAESQFPSSTGLNASSTSAMPGEEAAAQ